jgi:hypothetical protein
VRKGKSDNEDTSRAVGPQHDHIHVGGTASPGRHRSHPRQMRGFYFYSEWRRIQTCMPGYKICKLNFNNSRGAVCLVSRLVLNPHNTSRNEISRRKFLSLPRLQFLGAAIYPVMINGCGPCFFVVSNARLSAAVYFLSSRLLNTTSR